MKYNERKQKVVRTSEGSRGQGHPHPLSEVSLNARTLKQKSATSSQAPLASLVYMS